MHSSAADFLASGDIDGLLAFQRTRFGDLRAEDTSGGQGSGNGDGGSGSGSGGSGSDDKKFSQADMNATAARVEAAAKTKAETDLAAALGVSIDEAKSIITERRASDDAKKSEAERDREAAARDKADTERIKAEAATERHHARLERALGKAGLDVDNDTMLRAGLAALNVPTDADADAVKAAVEKLKTDAPALFGTATTNGGGTHSDTGGQGSGGQRKKDVPAGDFGKDGAAEAARRFPVKDKQPA